MPETIRRPFREIAFVGGRFDEAPGLLDLVVMGELQIYRKIVVETAKGRRLRRDPNKKSLPQGFGDDLRLGISGEIGEGSCRVPIARAARGESRQSGFDMPDEFDEAADLVEKSIIAIRDDTLFPDGMTVSALRELEKWGKSLAPGERVVLSAPGKRGGAVFDAEIRERLADRLPKPYYDTLELTGEVRGADIRKKEGGSFRIRLDYHGGTVSGAFTDEQEAAVTEALHRHNSVRLKIRARCAYHSNGDMRRIDEVYDCEIVRDEEDSSSSDTPSILRIFKDARDAVPGLTWDDVPKDYARNYKHYLYGHPKEGEE